MYATRVQCGYQLKVKRIFRRHWHWFIEHEERGRIGHGFFFPNAHEAGEAGKKQFDYLIKKEPQ